jgi:3D (Asp-Asp-Asp) domain-containing protein
VRGRRLIGTAALACGLLVGFALPASGAGPAQLRARADALQARNAALAARADAALLDLYALDTKLARAHARSQALAGRLAEVRREQAATQRELAAARSTSHVAQRELGRQLRVLYTRGEPDAIAILLGAGSLEEAVTGLENLQLVARHTRRISQQARAAQRRLAALRASLAKRASDVGSLAAAARDTEAALAGARADRASYLDGLAAERRLNAGEIGALQARAEEAARRSTQIATARPAVAVTGDAAGSSTASSTVPAPRPSSLLEADPGSTSGRTLTVSATGYALPGTTASGLPVGWGIVAVDPSVIPLGTKMIVPGYGEAVAADTGSAVQGLTIDLWFPTTAQALAWGRRSVTITLR